MDIIYISTPHNTHINYLRKALAAGKHVLCEKSITLNSEELTEAIQLAEENHVKLAEAMTIFHMPIYRKLSEIVESGKLGPLKVIQMNFGSYKEYDMTNRFFNRNLAGGALLDIGVYALSFVRWFMTSQPTEMVSQVKLAPTGVDEQAGILLTNAEGEMATVTLSLMLNNLNVVLLLMTRAISNFMNTHVDKRRSSPIRKMAHKKSSSRRTLKPSSMRFWIWKQPLQERMIIPTSITAEMSWTS